MNNIYLNFITNKLNTLNTHEYLFLVFFCILFLSIFVSLFILRKSINNHKDEKNKLLKKEKLLIKLQKSYKNGQITAMDYKKRIINLTKDENLL